jgi:hypothetical protein
MFVLRDEGTCEATTVMLNSGTTTNPLNWEVMSVYNTRHFRSNVTKHILIPPFVIHLIEGLTEIEHVLRPAHFWDYSQH